MSEPISSDFPFEPHFVQVPGTLMHVGAGDLTVLFLRRDLFKVFRTLDAGRDLLMSQNAFVERVLPASVVRPLSEAEMQAYRAPFLEPAAREPTWRFPNELPIAGAPAHVYAMAEAYQAWLLDTDLPKLSFWASLGALILEADAARLSRTRRNCRSIHIGRGAHFVQEADPHLVGCEIADWIMQRSAERSGP